MSYVDTLNQAWQEHLAPRTDDAPTVVSTFAGCGGSSLGYSMAGYRELLAVEWDRNAAETFRLNFPDVQVYQGDIGKLPVEQCLEMTGIGVGELDVFDGSPPCFPSGTMVFDQDGPKPIETVAVGSMVMTHSGSLAEVKSVHVRDYVGELVMIEPRYGRPYVTCTPNHQFFVKRKMNLKRCASDMEAVQPAWIQAQDLRSGDFLLEPAYQDKLQLSLLRVVNKQSTKIRDADNSISHESRLVERECDLDWHRPELAWVLGLYLAEGHLRGHEPSLQVNAPGRRSVIFSVRNSKAELAAQNIRRAGLNPYVQSHAESVTRITVTDSDLWLLCRVMGQYAHGKFIPAAFLTMPESWQDELLSGYFYGDGCEQHKNNGRIVKAITVSRPLAEGISRMVANVHRVVASIAETRPPETTTICGRIVNQRNYYTLSFRPDRSALDHLGHVDSHGVWIPVKRVHRTVPVSCRVYNLEVDRDHSYSANGFAVHNCQGFSTSGKRAYTDDRNQLFREYVRLLRGLQPQTFVMENVSGMIKGKMKLIFAEILRELKASGYQVSVRLLNAAHYGVPQARQRVIFIGVRNDLGLPPSHPLGHHALISARDALQDCAPSEIVPLIGKNLQRMRLIRPGATHREKEHASRMVFGKVNGFTLQRFKWNAPVPTILKTVCVSGTFGSGLVMPDENRYVSISELKRLASFPDQFQMIGTFQERWARIGNSVPPLLMRSIAQHIKTEILDRVGKRSSLEVTA